MNRRLASAYVKVHIAVLLFGMTGLFARYLDLNPLIIVFGRVFFSAIFIGIWLVVVKESFRLNDKKDYLTLAFLGILLAGHWTSFFTSIQLSNVAIGLLTFSTFPVFVSLFKPLISREYIKAREIVFACVTLLGIAFVVPFNDLRSDSVLGGLVGVLSGALYALFTIANERLAQTYSGKLVAFYEQVAAIIVLLPFLFIIEFTLDSREIGLLILLGTVFTGLGHSLFISGLKHVSAYMASIITMMEPLYSISLAYFLLGEKVSLNVLIGGSIILATVLYLSLSQRKTV